MTYTMEDQDKFKIIHIQGDVENDAEARKLIDELTRLARNGNYHYCFNLQNATYLNSSGVSIFIHALSLMEVKKGSVYMIAGDPQVHSVVELAGLDQLIKTFSTVEEFQKEIAA